MNALSTNGGGGDVPFDFTCDCAVIVSFNRTLWYNCKNRISLRCTEKKFLIFFLENQVVWLFTRAVCGGKVRWWNGGSKTGISQTMSPPVLITFHYLSLPFITSAREVPQYTIMVYYCSSHFVLTIIPCVGSGNTYRPLTEQFEDSTPRQLSSSCRGAVDGARTEVRNTRATRVRISPPRGSRQHLSSIRTVRRVWGSAVLFLRSVFAGFVRR